MAAAIERARPAAAVEAYAIATWTKLSEYEPA
jgi:hypothetical protein